MKFEPRAIILKNENHFQELHISSSDILQINFFFKIVFK